MSSSRCPTITSIPLNGDLFGGGLAEHCQHNLHIRHVIAEVLALDRGGYSDLPEGFMPSDIPAGFAPVSPR